MKKLVIIIIGIVIIGIVLIVGSAAQVLTPAVNSPLFTGTPSSGQIPVASNGTTAVWTSPSTWLDSVFGSTQGSTLERGAGGWQTVTPGTSGLPWVSNGAGADPGYQALTNTGLANMAANTVKCNSTNASSTPQDCARPIVFITDPNFGATTGNSNNATAINAALTFCASNGCAVGVPAATFLTCTLTVPTNAYLFGVSPATSIIKMSNSCNATLLTVSGPSHNVTIEKLVLDGNQANNTTGRVLAHNGQRPTFKDIKIINCAEFCISTSNSTSGYPTGGLEGDFERINIDTAQQTCWYHNGPTDSLFNNINIVDCGLQTNNTYYGFFNDTGGSGRYDHLHYSVRTSGQNQVIAGGSFNQIGNDCTNCYFESGITPLIVNSSDNTFTNTHIDAPIGPVAAKFNAGNIVYSGTCGGAAFAANPNYIGFQINSAGNIITVSDQGCNNGIFDFTSTGGSNILNASGTRSTITCFVGAPASTDQVNLQFPNLSGCNGVPWIVYTPVVTSGGGSFSGGASATGRFRLNGKSVEIEGVVTVTTVNTATTSVIVTLPAGITANPAAVLKGINGTNAFAASGNIVASGTSATFFKYDATFPIAANGQTLVFSGTFERQ